jgi:hypothetical protein
MADWICTHSAIQSAVVVRIELWPAREFDIHTPYAGFSATEDCVTPNRRPAQIADLYHGLLANVQTSRLPAYFSRWS